ncbi:MAG: DNA polymerase III subunit alpha, partial [Paludibacteraceae bacterium]|nr:DNA polymerase III subunit alpha [Paludibacteraceae bacterium]
MMNFVHLHVHSHYSILDGMSKVPALIDKCMKNGMHAMALTDHGNMYGIKEFLDTADKVNGKPKKAVKECEEAIAKETDPAKKAELERKLVELKQALADFVPFKPIVGIETYCAHESFADEKLPGHKQHRGWHLILLAKNKRGYLNLCKLSSKAFTEGFYYNARIDHELLEKYHEGLICCSACLGGEVPQKIMKEGEEAAEQSVLWFKRLFGDDYYLEMQRHKTDKPGGDRTTFERQQEVNEVLMRLAQKHGIKLIATNDVHFVEEDHAEAHDRLICLSTGKDFDDPNRMHYTKQEWLKTPAEMEAAFSDIPYVLENTLEIAGKIETYSINSDPIMPKFAIPESFGTEEEYRKKITEQQLFDEFTRDEHGQVVLSQEDAEKKIKKLGGYEKLYRIKLEADYLASLAWEGARKRYGDELTDEQRERIIFELHIMKTMGFPGYFLIVQDYIRAAREELDVWVGPGRGSAAGSVVAYCLGITDLDPLRYDLLFERFLNPDRISLPDIDVDFDDDGRGRVLDWVTQKYGADHVAHIITYGTMAAKSAVADVGRVQKIELSEVNRIKGYIPDDFKQTINPETGKPFDDGKTKVPKVNLKNCFAYIGELTAARYNDANPAISSMLKYAEQLEDTNRQVGIHACGVIIGADDLTNVAPVCTIRDKETDSDVVVTQYDGHYVESVGLIKMDFLGLKTLSLLKEAVRNVKKTRGIDVDIFNIPIDDELTYQLYQEGRTIGTFQFESPGMQKYLKELKPTQIEDLIAMNALYRPGPMDYIPQFIRRKQGLEPITYDIPIMEKYLKDTYGVTVYQEQVMLLSRLLANFTRGEADTLRKAMGKKIAAMLAMLKPKFLEGGKKNGHDPKVLEKIWADWEKFASYAFNKSHAACYAWVSYQTAYMKAHYPAEYMAANLTRSKDSITDVTKFMEECKAMNISVLGPDVNASDLNFVPDKDGNVRFGLGGVKGVGEGAVAAIVDEREKNGPYRDIYDFFARVNLNACNRKTLESLVLSGAFDSLGSETREQFFATNTKGESMLELLMRYGNHMQQSSNRNDLTLFDVADITIDIPRPKFLPAVPW